MRRELSGKSILITGATGLVGKSLIFYLDSLDREKNGGTTVFACCRSRDKFDRCFSACRSLHLIPIFGDICNLDISSCDFDYVIHAASATASKDFVQKPVETIRTAVVGTMNLLEQCKNKRLKGFVYLSSLEVYGKFDVDGIKAANESDYGRIDPLAVRSSYSEGKRMCENLCCSYAAEYGIPVKIARLAQVFGKGVEYSDQRVFAQFAHSVIEKKDIVLRTKGETVRNYCHTEDAAAGIIAVLLEGKAGEAYNVANSDTMISIAGMARLFCDLYPEAGSKVVFDLSEDASKLGYNPVMKLQLDASKLEALGWTPKFGLKEMIRDLVDSMRCALS